MKWFVAALSLVSVGVAFVPQTPKPMTPAAELGTAIPGLTPPEQKLFNSGRQLFGKVWLPQGNPALFNGRSCIQCHSDPAFGGASDNVFNHVFIVPDENDVTGWRVAPWRVYPRGQILPTGEYEMRRAQSLYGLGLLEAVSEEELAKREDPNDANKDGISGRLFRYPDGTVGRFGWKGNKPSIESFTHKAFELELGIKEGQGTDDNHLSPERVLAVAQTMRFLSPPREEVLNSLRAKGKELFTKIGCASCHTPELTTGKSDYPSLANRVIQPYSDLLLHDVSRGPAQKSPEKGIGKREFRTAPLWGIGNFTGPYWHDGSCESLEEAINRHEGEALAVTQRWKKLDAASQKALISFLEGL
jgi:CxxC motif-containing protein (DUF1111 family)